MEESGGWSVVEERSDTEESGMEESGAWKKEASWKSGMEERRHSSHISLIYH